MPRLDDAIQRRRVDLAAEGARQRRPGVVDEDDEDVRRILGQAARLDALLDRPTPASCDRRYSPTASAGKAGSPA